LRKRVRACHFHWFLCSAERKRKEEEEAARIKAEEERRLQEETEARFDVSKFIFSESCSEKREEQKRKEEEERRATQLQLQVLRHERLSMQLQSISFSTSRH
jgi:hypothetical protein